MRPAHHGLLVGAAHHGLLVGAMLLPLLGCRPQGDAQVPAQDPSPALEPPPPVDHGPPPAFTGSFVGPALRLTFAGPWVLVEPVDPPGQPPLELRVAIERREGDAFALRTSVAGVMPSDFLRPTDWTLLVEADALAIAMGDEPLERYARIDPRAGDSSDAAGDPRDATPLLGPSMLHELPLPETLPFAAASGCLELASLVCAALEADGPRAAGCREAAWGACVGHVLASDERPQPGSTGKLVIRTQTILLRFCQGLLAAAPADQRASAQRLHARALQQAAAALREREAAGELPHDDPGLPRLLTMLRAAVDRGQLEATAIAGLPTEP